MHSSGITAEDEGHIEWVKRPSVTNNAHILSPSTTLQSDGGLWFTERNGFVYTKCYIFLYLLTNYNEKSPLKLYSTAFRRQ